MNYTISFLFNVPLITFFLYQIFNPKSSLICSSRASNFFTIKFCNHKCPCYCICKFFNRKNFFCKIWLITSCKNIFAFIYLFLHYSFMITNLKLSLSCMKVKIRVSICIRFYISKFNLTGLIFIKL